MTPLALLALLAQAAPGPQGPQGPPEPGAPRTLASWIRDLRSDRAPTRLAAAREVRRRARLAARVVDHAPRGSLVWQEQALVIDQLLDEAVPPCLERVREGDRAARPCADTLGWLEVPEALPALRAALEREHLPRGHRRALRRAIRRIEAGQ